MIAAIYGVQALVFIMRRKWDMIGWMLFYVLAIPAFSFFLPLYSFWRMDDFSWGQTRMVLGESGKKLIVHDEGKFDPKAIPLKSWSDYVSILESSCWFCADVTWSFRKMNSGTRNRTTASDLGFHQRRKVTPIQGPLRCMVGRRTMILHPRSLEASRQLHHSSEWVVSTAIPSAVVSHLHQAINRAGTHRRASLGR
jgi:hypothetical protein